MATYENINRQDFEDWLFERCPVFERVEDTAGVYLVPVSSAVAVKVTTTLTGADRTTRRGEGRCRMRFVTRYGLRRISLTGDDRLDANRTRGWRENWQANLDTMMALFRKSRARYTKLALQTQPEYAQEWIERIESVSKWKDFSILVSIRKQLEEGRWLTPKQEAAVWRFSRPKVSSGGGPRRSKTKAKRATTTRSPMTPDQKRMLEAVCRLEVVAQEADDEWLLKFCESLSKRLKSGRDLTTRQRETLVEKLKTFNLKIPSAA